MSKRITQCRPVSSCGIDGIIYKGSDIVVALNVTEQELSAYSMIEVSIYTDDINSKITAYADELASVNIVSFDGYVYAIYESSDIEKLNEGSIKWEIETALKSNMFSDNAQNSIDRGNFNYILKS